MGKAKSDDPKASPSLASLEQALAGYEAELGEITSRMTVRRKAVAELNAKLVSDEHRKRDLEGKAAETQNRIFARSVLRTPALVKVRSARKAYLSQLEQSKSEDITVATKRQLVAGLELALPMMQSICPHPFVFSYDGYKGSHLNDWDDQRHGHRVCTVCNLREMSKGTDKDIYEKMPKDETRLVRRDLRRVKDRPSLYCPEWFTLDFLQDLFERSAGGINVDWPDEVDKNSLAMRTA